MTLSRDRTESLTELVRSEIRKSQGVTSTYTQATFVAVDGVDPNLSTVTVFGATTTRVRKISSVGVMTAGQQLLCVQGNGMPLTIIGILVGNIT